MLIKKALILLIFVIFSAIPVSAYSEPTVSAKAAVVMDADTLSVLFDKNAEEKLSMASTTKIMTGLLAVESGRLYCTVTASDDINVDGTSIGISKGDSFTLYTLVHAMMLESGNDAAVLTAEYISGSEGAFSELMNQKASELGMNSTNFVTASGLDSEEHYSTAYDMALLASHAIKNPVLRSVSQKETYSAEYIKPKKSVTYTNHNKLLKIYDGIIGLKTGFTKKSGRCLVSACEKNGRTLIVTTMNAPDDWNDHIKLYDYCFNVSDSRKLDYFAPESISVYGGKQNSLKLSLPDINVFDVYGKLSCEVLLPDFLYAPISKGEVIGRVVLYSDGIEVSQKFIRSAEDVYSAEGSSYIKTDVFFKLRYFFNNLLKGR